jgi:hypothetical protein
MAIDSRLLAAVLPLAAATLSRRREKPVEESDRFWEQVRAVAPAPVWDYILAIDAECAAATGTHREFQFDDGAWLRVSHPALEDVLEALEGVQRVAPADRLTYVQGYTLMWATARLGWAFAYERADGTRAVVFDQDIRDQAGLLLLGWDDRTCNRHWADPCAFLEQWREHRFACEPDVDVLAKAGLHELELELLDAEGEC